jgi:hypothetical protein
MPTSSTALPTNPPTSPFLRSASHYIPHLRGGGDDDDEMDYEYDDDVMDESDG